MSHNLAQSLHEDNLLAESTAALAAGLSAAALTLAFKLLYQPVPIGTYFRFILLGLVSYLLVALLLHKFWKGLLGRVIPKWLLIAILGSVVFVVLRLTPGVIGGWYDPLRLEHSFEEYITTEINAAASVVLFLCAIAIPTAGLVYYSFSIVRLLKRREPDQ